jgi:hypothetical protein
MVLEEMVLEEMVLEGWYWRVVLEGGGVIHGESYDERSILETQPADGSQVTPYRLHASVKLSQWLQKSMVAEVMNQK